MGCQVGLVGEFVAGVAGSADDVLQHLAYVAVQVGLCKGTVLDGFDYALDLVGHAGLHEVVACVYRGYGALFVAPVGHDYAAEAPLVTQDGGEQALALLCKLAVDLVVGTHDGPGVRLLDGDLEALEGDFAQGPGVHAAVVVHAVDFLVVGCVMLDAHANAVALDAAYVCGGHLSAEERIFGEVLEVAAAQGVAVDVHTRGEEHVGAIFKHLVAHCGGELFNQRCVPGGCKHGAHGEAGAVEGLVSAGAGRVDAEACRAVCQNGVGDAQAGDCTGGAGSAGDQGCVGRGERAGGHAAPAAAHHEGGLLFEGHCGEDFVDVVGCELGLGRKAGCAQGCGGDEDQFLHYRCGFTSGANITIPRQVCKADLQKWPSGQTFEQLTKQ